MKTDSFEKKMDELEKIVEKLEEGNLSLDESLKLFERGVKLSADGMKLLDESESRVQKLSVLAQADQNETRSGFENEEEEDFFNGVHLLMRGFRVCKALDAHRFLYRVYVWEGDGAGYGVYDLATRTDHRITGRGAFLGMGGNTLYGDMLMADADTYETSTLPEVSRNQMEQINGYFGSDYIHHDISPDGRLFALFNRETDDVYTITVTDIRAGKVVWMHEVKDVAWTPYWQMAFRDETRLILFHEPLNEGSPHIYLIDLSEAQRTTP